MNKRDVFIRTAEVNAVSLLLPESTLMGARALLQLCSIREIFGTTRVFLSKGVVKVVGINFKLTGHS